MSWQTDITNAVANLTQRLNTITQQARKIFELPWQSTLRSSSKIHVSNDENESEFITVQQIVDAALSFRQNQLLNATIDVDGNDVKVDSGAKWIINNINYELTSDFVVNVPYAVTGYTRNDILYADQFNLIHREVGPETEGVSPTPNTPLNTVLVTIISVTDSTIGNTPPVIGDDPDFDKVLKTGNIATDVGFVLNHSSEISILSASNQGVIAENGASKVTLLANELKNENSNETISYNSNSITWTDKLTGYISRLWFNRTASGLAEFHLRANKPAGSYNLVTDDELDLKLNISDYNQHFRGKYTSLALLQAAIPTGNDGDYAIIDTGTGVNAKEYIWDAQEGWIQSSSASASTTDALPEGSTNLYFTTARVLSTVLTGISFLTGTAVTAADSILVAFGKMQKQINDNISIINGLLVPQITITTTTSITTSTNDVSGYGQKGRNVIIDNGSNVINLTVNASDGFSSSYLKHGTGQITFVQGSGRNLIVVYGSPIMNGNVGSTATISSVGTTDYLRISNI